MRETKENDDVSEVIKIQRRKVEVEESKRRDGTKRGNREAREIQEQAGKEKGGIEKIESSEFYKTQMEVEEKCCEGKERKLRETNEKDVERSIVNKMWGNATEST